MTNQQTKKIITTTAPVDKCPECGCTSALIFASGPPLIMHEVGCSIAERTLKQAGEGKP